MSIGSTIPVESFPPKPIAISGIAIIAIPLTPALEIPKIKAQQRTKIH
jgi:hypothetical protein